MNPFKLLWSFYGRIGRLAYLGGLLLNLAWAAAVFAGVVYLDQGRAPEEFPMGLPIMVVGFPLFTWAKFALAAKRLHDLDKSGWISLVLIIPLVGLIAVIFLLCASGDAFDNQYGPARRSAGPLPQPSRP